MCFSAFCLFPLMPSLHHGWVSCGGEFHRSIPVPQPFSFLLFRDGEKNVKNLWGKTALGKNGKKPWCFFPFFFRVFSPISTLVLLLDWIPQLFTTTTTTTIATTMAPTASGSQRFPITPTGRTLNPGRLNGKSSGTVATKRPGTSLSASTDRKKPLRPVPTTRKPARPCESHPCLHGGTCEDDGRDFTCSCPAGRGGAVCEKGKFQG